MSFPPAGYSRCVYCSGVHKDGEECTRVRIERETYEFERMIEEEVELFFYEWYLWLDTSEGRFQVYVAERDRL